MKWLWVNICYLKKIKRQYLKRRDHFFQQRDNTLPDTFGLEETTNKHESYDMNLHELRDELTNQKLENQTFLFKGKSYLNGKFIETIMPFKDIEAFEIYLESIDGTYNEESIVVQEADIFREQDLKNFIKSNEMIVIRKVISLIKRWLDILVELVSNCFNIRRKFHIRVRLGQVSIYLWFVIKIQTRPTVTTWLDCLICKLVS